MSQAQQSTGKVLSSLKQLTPAFFRQLSEGYSTGDFKKDLAAGITVGIVALPLAMAFAIGAGASPAQGLYTAIVAGFIAAFLGGSFHQVSGPTGAFVVIIADIIAQFGMPGLQLATLIAGLLLIFMAITGLGSIIKYIPYPVTIGFTTGIGVTIFVGQLKDFFGMAIPSLSPEFFEKIGQYAEYWRSANLSALGAGLATVGIIILIRKTMPKLPAAVTAVAVVTAAAFLLNLPLETVGSKFGALPKGFPAPRFPELSFSLIRKVFPSALTIALLAAIESLLSAVVADGMTGTRHSSSAELNGQGLGNIASVLFGGIPATGAIARTATNIKSGARSPVSGMIHAIVLLLFTLFLGPVVQAIPLATLAGVLLVVAVDMSELPRFFSMRKAPKSDLAVMVTTFVLTVVVDLTAAVEVGVILAIILFVKRARDTTSVATQTDWPKEAAELLESGMAKAIDKKDLQILASRKIPKGCEVYEINGPFFFGVADILQDTLSGLEKTPKVFILRMRHVPAIDATGLNALRSFSRHCRHHGTVLVLSSVNEQPSKAIANIGLAEEIGLDNIVGDIDEALARAGKVFGSISGL
ncbi:MAG TPA: SulP family inorganic anion transporter [Rectinemataceae bacterium]|nr:SulP family inorganic anion transporter [Rectinemataceae bacterium]